MTNKKIVKRILILICSLVLISGLVFLLVSNIESDFEKKVKELSQQYDVSNDEVKFMYDMSCDWELVTDQLESAKKTEERKQIEKTREVELLNNSEIRLFLEEEIYLFGNRVSIVYDKTRDNIISFFIDGKEK